MRKNKFFAVLILSLCLVIPLTGCDLVKDILWHWSRNKDVEITTTEASHGVYQMNLNETRLIKAACELSTDSAEELISSCIEEMRQAPSDNAYKCLIYGDVQVTNYTYDSSSRLVTLYFDPAYNKLPPSREILTRAGIVKTLTQFSDDIQYVSFVIGSEPMTAADGTALLMRGKDFVDSISGNMEYVREDYVTMYFVSGDGTRLQAEDVIVKYLSKINLETALVNSLVSGPITKGLKPSLSPDTVVNKVSIREGICYVDVDKTFLERVDGQSFELNIYSVVNTLTQMTGVSRVQFLIDGAIFTGAVEGMHIDGMFEKNMSLVYRPEKEGTAPPSRPAENCDALKKDIEQQVKENQMSSEETGPVETGTEPGMDVNSDEAGMGEAPVETAPEAEPEPIPENNEENTGE